MLGCPDGNAEERRMLEWTHEYVDQAVTQTDFGVYRVGDADSLGQREVTLTYKRGEVFVATVYMKEGGMAAAEKHYKWVTSRVEI